MKLRLIAALAFSTLALAGAAEAQGIPGGMERGAREGNRVAGPVGGIVGGAVGGAVGGVNGVLGIDPGRRAYRTNLRGRHDRSHRRHRHYR
ncbi:MULTISPECIES: hypothetical protein [Methylobacterium]|jgi:hypothetical protein|uniref:Uncharacterized protein n=2 Tax=Methylobacterium TaxID=407 RepID=A0A0C6FAA2_9HYPH|nr:MULTISPECIES: hypothetical protein [Methylobacterium]MBK3399480.1 hypothetical protein [Methylobacterium ajmalii]MBK3407023.1 hypothetical protein [Methylobacterium ajmalii]MBK3422431.1 hypothetical protein [Methylobacterium ajmalii]MBZ6411401.1 hypothetical protein [Methylobacterium sp.]SFE57310.1 hypothetical protein SAMN04487844_104116 [Methylobacterium sp. yr596]